MSVCVQGLIFVVDSNDPERIKEAAEELHMMVRNQLQLLSIHSVYQRSIKKKIYPFWMLQSVSGLHCLNQQFLCVFAAGGARAQGGLCSGFCQQAGFAPSHVSQRRHRGSGSVEGPAAGTKPPLTDGDHRSRRQTLSFFIIKLWFVVFPFSGLFRPPAPSAAPVWSKVWTGSPTGSWKSSETLRFTPSNGSRKENLTGLQENLRIVSKIFFLYFTFLIKDKFWLRQKNKQVLWLWRTVRFKCCLYV